MEQFRGIGGNDILEVQFVDVSGAQLIQSDPDTLAILAHGRVSDLDGQLVVFWTTVRTAKFVGVTLS